MADGESGSVYVSEPGYDEPPRSTGNRSQTDYSEAPEVKETRRGAFDDGRAS
jgi:hypothetical protein